MRRPEDRVEALAAGAGREREAASRPGSTPSIASRLRWKSSLVGLKTTKWSPGDGLVAHPVPLGARAPEERVVERVEVGAVRNRRALRVQRPVGGHDVLLQPRGRLDRGGYGRSRRGAGSPCSTCARRRPRPRGPAAPSASPLAPPGRGRNVVVHPLGEVEVEVPRLEVLEEVRERHVRAASEVAAPRQVDVAERLEVGDPRRPEPGTLGGGEAEKELRRVRDQLGARDAGGERHPLRQAACRPSKPPPGEALAHARHRERALELGEDRLRALLDVLAAGRCAAGRRRRCPRARVVGVVARKADRRRRSALQRLAATPCRGPQVDGRCASEPGPDVARGSTAAPRRP